LLTSLLSTEPPQNPRQPERAQAFDLAGQGFPAYIDGPVVRDTVTSLQQRPTLIRLPQVGIHVNDHDMMLENNSASISAVMANWLIAKGL
jgi:hypothetical protein